MSTAGVLALVLTAAWLAILTLILILVVRQIGLITVRLSVASEAFSLDSGGPDVGEEITDEAQTVLPELEGRAYLLLLSAGCDPCIQLAKELHELRLDHKVIALIPGDLRKSADIASLLPDFVQSIRGSEADIVADTLGIRSTPFALELKDGLVSGKAHLYRGAADLVALVEAKDAAEQNGGITRDLSKEGIR
jgi:hypothetical protein